MDMDDSVDISTEKKINEKKAKRLHKVFTGHYYPTVVKILTAGLMIAVSIWILTGIFALVANLFHVAEDGWEKVAHHSIMKIITMLAMLELLRTLYSYLQLGRVKVTFILDAALVVLIGELIGLWYREYTATEVVLSLVVITVLVVLRIVTSKYSPHVDEDQHSEL